MANNFRLIGNRYISKDGDDVNDGLTPDTPKATLNYYATATHILGSGVYKGSFSLNSLRVTVPYIADGYVKILCSGDLVLAGTGSNSLTIFNSETEGTYFDIDYNGFKLLAARSTFRTFRTIHKNGIFQTTTTGDARLEFFNSVISDMTSSNNYYLFKFDKTLIFNTDFNALFPTEGFLNTYVVNTYVDSASTFTMTAYFPTPASQFTNNNFQGKFSIGGIIYELKKDKSGIDIPSRIANGVADLASIDATVYDRGNFSQDPEFLNIDKRDYFSVSNTSPMLFGADDGSNIGGVVVAEILKADSGGFITGMLLDAGDFVINDPPDTSGTALVNPAFQIAPIPQVINGINPATLLAFNSDEAINSTENDQVPILDNFTTGTAGANPRRLTYEMRWSNSDTLPTVDADFDNQGYITAGDYAKFEWFTKPLIDVAGNGNGEATFVVSGAVGLKAKWVQLRVVLLEGIG